MPKLPKTNQTGKPPMMAMMEQMKENMAPKTPEQMMKMDKKMMGNKLYKAMKETKMY